MLPQVTVRDIHSISSRVPPGLIDWLLILEITVFIDILGVTGLGTSLQLLGPILPPPVLLKQGQEIDFVLDNSLVVLQGIQWLGVKVNDGLWGIFHFLFDNIFSVLLGKLPNWLQFLIQLTHPIVTLGSHRP